MCPWFSVSWTGSEWHHLVALGGCCVGFLSFLPHSLRHSLTFPLTQVLLSRNSVRNSPPCHKSAQLQHPQESGERNAWLKSRLHQVAFSQVIYPAALPGILVNVKGKLDILKSTIITLKLTLPHADYMRSYFFFKKKHIMIIIAFPFSRATERFSSVS